MDRQTIIQKKFNGTLKIGMKVWLVDSSNDVQTGTVSIIKDDNNAMVDIDHTSGHNWIVERNSDGYWGGDCMLGYLCLDSPKTLKEMLTEE